MNPIQKITIAVLLSWVGGSIAATLSIVPNQSLVAIGETASFDVTISGLGDRSAPSLGSFDLDLRSDNASVLPLGNASVSFGDDLRLSGSSLRGNEASGDALLRVYEASFVSTAALNGSQPDEFRLTTIQYQAGQLGEATVDFSHVLLGGADGVRIDNIVLQPGSVEVSIVSQASGASSDGVAVGDAMTNACVALADMPSSTLTEGQRGLLNTCRSLVELSPEQAAALVNESAPLIQKPKTRYSLELSHAQFANVLTRLRHLRGGGGGSGVAGLQLKIDGRWVDSNELNQLLGAALGGAAGDGEDGIADTGRLGVYLNAGLGQGERKNSALEKGFDFDTQALTLGADYRLKDQLIVGAALGYGHTKADFEQSRDDTEVDGWSAMLYGTYYPSESLYIDGIASAGIDNFDINRFDPYSGRIAKGDTDGHQYGLSLGGGYDFQQGRISFGPLARLTYAHVSVDGYRESAVDGNEYIYEDQDADSLSSLFGGQISYVISTAYGVFIPQLMVDWTHEFKNDGKLVNSRLANDPTSTSIALKTDQPDRDYFNLGLGVSAQFAHGVSGYLFYDKLLGHEYVDSDSLQLGMRMEF